MEDTKNVENQNTTKAQHVKSTRWDKAQQKKENGRLKKQQIGLNIRNTRSRTIANTNIIDTDLQGEMVSLVIKDSQEIKGLQNKRKKFEKPIAIPNDITLQGETRDANRAIKREETG